MWNIYIMALVFLYAPSHKNWNSAATDATPGSARLDGTQTGKYDNVVNFWCPTFVCTAAANSLHSFKNKIKTCLQWVVSPASLFSVGLLLHIFSHW
jgi:hypothetical protein